MMPTHQQLAEQLDSIESLLREHIANSQEWRERTDIELKRNSEVTDEVRNIATTGRTIRSAVIWLGGLAGGAVGLWELWKVLR